MTREDASEILSDEEISCLIWKFHGAKEALDLALTALRPVSRERVERIWFREPYSRLETRQGDDGSIVYSAVNTCMACGHETPIGNFCHNCGVAQNKDAVEMVMKRLRVLTNDNKETDMNVNYLVKAINDPDRIIRKPRFTEQEVESARTIKVICPDADRIKCRISENKGRVQHVCKGNRTMLTIWFDAFPSIQTDEYAKLDEIIGGAK